MARLTGITDFSGEKMFSDNVFYNSTDLDSQNFGYSSDEDDAEFGFEDPAWDHVTDADVDFDEMDDLEDDFDEFNGAF